MHFVSHLSVANATSRHPIISALLSRNERIGNIFCSYHENIDELDGAGKRIGHSTSEVLGKADRATSSGWLLSVSKSREGESLILTVTRRGDSIVQLFKREGGDWNAQGSAMQAPGEQPVDQCASFFYKGFLPEEVAATTATQTVGLVRGGSSGTAWIADSRTMNLPVASAWDRDSSITISLAEPAILSFSGHSGPGSGYALEEQMDDFERVNGVGLVPRLKHTKSRVGEAQTSSTLTVKNLEINNPKFSLGAEDESTSAILARYARY